MSPNNESYEISETKLRYFLSNDNLGLNILIEYVTVLLDNAEEEFVVLAKKATIYPEHRTEALIKKGIVTGYENILNRLTKLRLTGK